jgi:quinol-cytochrome oxidoreductase complex cytochrome b subunit
MLSRIFALHTSNLQIILITILALKIFYIKYFGVSPKPYQTEEEYQASLDGNSTFMGHAKLLGILSAGLFTIIFVLALFFQPGLFPAAKPGMEMTKPAWIFWILVPFENVFGIPGILIGSAVIAAWFLSFPIIGIILRDERKLFKTVYGLVAIGLIFWVTMMSYTYFAPAMSHF